MSDQPKKRQFILVIAEWEPPSDGQFITRVNRVERAVDQCTDDTQVLVMFPAISWEHPRSNPVLDVDAFSHMADAHYLDFEKGSLIVQVRPEVIEALRSNFQIRNKFAGAFGKRYQVTNDDIRYALGVREVQEPCDSPEEEQHSLQSPVGEFVIYTSSYAGYKSVVVKHGATHKTVASVEEGKRRVEKELRETFKALQEMLYPGYVLLKASHPSNLLPRQVECDDDDLIEEPVGVSHE